MGENEKVTKMVLKVDLQSEKCYRKVKKVLCKFPEIRDQAYDEKKNEVIIKVVCCSPEKIRDKLCCKGRCVITSIDIIIPPPPPPPPPPPSPPKSPSKKCTCPPVCPRPPVCPSVCPRPPVCPPVCPRPPVCPPVCPRTQVNKCCTECNRGHPGGPCQTGCSCRQYDSHCWPVYDSYRSWRSYNTSYCVTRTDCFSEENPQVCAIM